MAAEHLVGHKENSCSIEDYRHIEQAAEYAFLVSETSSDEEVVGYAEELLDQAKNHLKKVYGVKSYSFPQSEEEYEPSEIINDLNRDATGYAHLETIDECPEPFDVWFFRVKDMERNLRELEKLREG